LGSVKKVKKIKLNVKALIILLLFIYLIVMLLYTFFTMPIKNIYINNTTLLSDNDIIQAAGIKDYPSLFKVSAKKLEKNILALELVDSVNIKKDLRGRIIIDIKEAIPLLYNRNIDKVVLSNKKEVGNKYLGIPSLINSVPSDLLYSFIEAFSNIDPDIIKMINEIEYNPHVEYNEETNESVVIDSQRFLLRMNDTNTVYVNIMYLERLNDYKSIIMTIGDDRGVVLLDSDNSENNVIGLFTSYKDIEELENDVGDNGEDDGEN